MQELSEAQGRPMKAITLHQPYASLIATGNKTFKTRSWPAPRSLLGERIAIHAGKKRDGAVYRNCVLLTPGAHAFAACDEYIRVTAKRDPDPWSAIARFPLGAVVATARIYAIGQVTCHTRMPDRVGVEWTSALIGGPKGKGIARTDEYGDFSVGRWLWWLTEVDALDPPVPAKGALGFWEWDPP